MLFISIGFSKHKHKYKSYPKRCVVRFYHKLYGTRTILVFFIWFFSLSNKIDHHFRPFKTVFELMMSILLFMLNYVKWMEWSRICDSHFTINWLKMRLMVTATCGTTRKLSNATFSFSFSFIAFSYWQKFCFCSCSLYILLFTFTLDAEYLKPCTPLLFSFSIFKRVCVLESECNSVFHRHRHSLSLTFPVVVRLS